MQTSVRINDDPIGAGIRAGARLWLHWVGATTLGVVAAFAMFVVLYTIIGEPGDLLFPVLMAGVGLSFGAGQQRVLRNALGDARRWALATGLGLGLGIALALVIGEGAGLAARVEAGLVHGAAVGAIIGLLQWPILRPRVTGSRWWVLASILAWTVGAAAADTVGYFADGFDIMAGPIAAAAVSGIALAVLLRSSEAQPGAGAASASTTPDRPRSDWPVRLRSRWLALNIVGFAVGGAIYGGLQRARMQPYYEVVTSGSEAARLVAVNTGTGLAIFGALLGGWQWLALRADLRASWWLPATCLGWAVGGAAAGAISGVAAGSVTTIGPDHWCVAVHSGRHRRLCTDRACSWRPAMVDLVPPGREGEPMAVGKRGRTRDGLRCRVLGGAAGLGGHRACTPARGLSVGQGTGPGGSGDRNLLRGRNVANPGRAATRGGSTTTTHDGPIGIVRVCGAGRCQVVVALFVATSWPEAMT